MGAGAWLAIPHRQTPQPASQPVSHSPTHPVKRSHSQSSVNPPHSQSAIHYPTHSSTRSSVHPSIHLAIHTHSTTQAGQPYRSQPYIQTHNRSARESFILLPACPTQHTTTTDSLVLSSSSFLPATTFTPWPLTPSFPAFLKPPPDSTALSIHIPGCSL